MKKYKYTAININKEKFSGTFIANDVQDLAKQLAKQDLFLVSSSVYTDESPSAFFTLGTGKITVDELTTFCRLFAIMIDAGFPVLDCLDSMRTQSFSSYFKSIINVVYDDVKSGVMLSDAINKHKKAFPEFFLSMISVGEVSGKLNLVMNSLADYYERDNSIKKKTKGALSYPIMLIAMTIGIVILMMVYIVPTFRTSLSSLNVEATGLTKAVYNASDFMLSYWLEMLAIVAVIGFAIFGISLTKKGRMFFDKMKVKLPVIKNINIAVITARFCRSFSLLLASGLDISEALDAVKIVIGNKYVEEKFVKASEEVRHGAKLAETFEKYDLFPQVMLQMVSIGERTAALDEVLGRSASYFDELVESTLNSTVSKIQPAILIIMGGVIAMLFIAVYSPMISIMTTLL